jgi:MarR family transcriptional regulator for hemolysin
MNKGACHQLVQVTHNKRALLDEKMKAHKLCRTQWRALAQFIYLSKPITQQDLLKALDIDPAHLARTLESIEEMDLIKRETVPNNKRARYVLLTPKGEDLLIEIQAIIDWEASVLYKDFTTQERQQFEDLLGKMDQNIAQALRSFHHLN